MAGWLDFRILKWPQELIDEVICREGEFKFGKDGTSTAISDSCLTWTVGKTYQFLSRFGEDDAQCSRASTCLYMR